MDLHRSGLKPDWSSKAPDEWNAWQRIAAQTNGFVTPANIVTIWGALFVLAGLGHLLTGQAWLGIVLIAAGRLFDAFDGVVAQRTGTKSRFGALLDAGTDKLLALLALTAFSVVGLVPIWLALMIAAQNLANIAATFIGQARGVIVQPSRMGKIATAGYWAGLLCFLLASLQSTFTSGLSLMAYMASLAALAMGVAATTGYFEEALFGIGQPLAVQRFKRYVIIRNPVSSDAHMAGERIQALKECQPESTCTILETVAGGREANAAMLRDHAALFDADTLLCIAAGDGTVHMILNILLHDEGVSEKAKRMPMLPFWGGNANDLAYMLNGGWSKRKLRQVLTHGNVVQIKPIEITLTYPDATPAVRIASSYVSFGASAYASYELEHALPRRSRLRRFMLSRVSQEWIAAMRALVSAPTFCIASHGRKRAIYERTYLNGSRFAKIIGTPMRLTDEKFHRVTIERKHPIAVALHLLGLLRNREIPRRAITHDEFTLLDDVWAQFDGEPMKVPSGTRVTLTVNRTPFYALSTRLGKS